MAKRRSKAEIEAENLAKEMRKAERMAKRAAKDAEAERKRKAKVAAEAKREREQRLLTESLAKRTAAQQSAYEAEVEALSIEEPGRKKQRREVRNMMIAVAYLCDHSVEETRLLVIPTEGKGAVHSIVNKGKLEIVRKSEHRIKRLADLFDKIGLRLQPFVMHCAATSPTKRLHRDLLNHMSIRSERVTETQRMRGGGEMTWNPHVSALHKEASLGGIDEHCLQTGVWLSSVFNRIGQGGVRGFDPTSAGVRGTGGGKDAIETDAAVKADAINQIREVEDHIRRAFLADGSWQVRWKIIEHVVRYDRGLDRFDLPKRFGAPVKFLNEALEEASFCRNMAPSGVYSNAVSSEEAAILERELYAKRELEKAVRWHKTIVRAEKLTG